MPLNRGLGRPLAGSLSQRVVCAVFATLVGLTVTASSAAASGSTRTIVKNYTGFGGTTLTPYPNVFLQDQLGDEVVGGTVIEARTNETRVHVRIADATGSPVAARVIYTKPGASESSELVVCERTTRSITIDPSGGVGVFPVIGFCQSYAPSVPTRGQIQVTLLKKGNG